MATCEVATVVLPAGLRRHVPPYLNRAIGFTLVELLVVIGIIALLISILLPSLNAARRAANVVACASNMRQIAQAMLLYSADNKGRLIPMRVTGSAIYPNGFFWTNELVRNRYITAPNCVLTASTFDYKRTSVFRCPQANFDENLTSAQVGALVPQYPADVGNDSGYYDSNAKDPATGVLNFGVATWYEPVGGTSTSSNTFSWPALSTVTPANQTPFPFIYFKDATGDTQMTQANFNRTLSQIHRSSEFVMLVEANSFNWVSKSSTTGVHLTNRLAARHGRKTADGSNAYGNFAFFDGHVAYFPTEPFDTQYLTAFDHDTIFLMNKANTH